MAEKTQDTVDWGLTTWDGAKREALRRWSALPLERVVAALEEMQELGDMLQASELRGTDHHQETTDGNLFASPCQPRPP